MFVGYMFMGVLLAAGFYMREENYRTFEAGLFAIYISLVAGNVGRAWIEAKHGTTRQATTTNNSNNEQEYAN